MKLFFGKRIRSHYHPKIRTEPGIDFNRVDSYLKQEAISRIYSK